MLFLQIFLPIVIFIVGVCLASFGNVLVTRYPDWSFKGDKSYSICPECGHKLSWRDLFPLISYLCLGGKCRYCKAKIPVSYFLIELFGGLMFVSCYFLYLYIYPNYKFTFNVNVLSIVNFIACALSLLILLCSALIDKKYKEAPLTFSISLFVIAVATWGINFAVTKDYSLVRVLGFAIPFGLFGLIYLISVVFFKVEPIGITDIIVYCSIGLLLGALNFIIILLVSTLVCAIREMIKIKKTGQKGEIAFLPYIFIGFVVAVYLGQLIIDGYLKLIGA